MHPMMAIFSVFRQGNSWDASRTAFLMRAMVPCRSYRVRPHPGQEMNSVCVKRTRAACRMLSARRGCSWPLLVITRSVASPSIRGAPAAMAAFSIRSSSSSSFSESVITPFSMAAVCRSWAHSSTKRTSLRATGISHSGSSESDTLMVSPSPSVSRAPMPTALLTRPSSPSPASVTPRCRGKCMSSRSIASTRRRTERTITTVLLALMLSTTSWKSSFRHTRRNSMHDSTIPSGVSPKRDMIRSESDPWFTPMRTAV